MNNVIQLFTTNGGVTVDSKGKVAELRSGYLVTVRSRIVPKQHLTAELLAAVREINGRAPDAAAHLYAGAFRLPNGSVSVDINVHMKHRVDAVALGRLTKQHSIWDCKEFDIIETGGDGMSTVSLTWGEIAGIVAGQGVAA